MAPSLEPGTAEIVTTTARLRQKMLRDNVTNHNAALFSMEKNEGIVEEGGGRTILEEMAFQENGTGMWYEGGQVLNTAYNPTMTAAEFNWKQLAAGVVLTGLEKRQNSGEEGYIKLLDGRIKIAEDTLDNLLNAAVFSDGTGFGGLQLGGLKLLISQTPSSGVVGGIDRSTTAGTFYRNYAYDAVNTGGAATNAANIKVYYNTCFVNTTRNNDKINLIIAGQTHFLALQSALQAIQRITKDTSDLADAGFEALEYLGRPVVLGNGVNFGGETLISNTVSYGLNTKHLKMRVHKDCYMEPLPEVQSINQDAIIQFICFMGNCTLSGGAFQFVLFG